MERNDFYEEDEPIEEILAGWVAGEKGLTAPPLDESPTRGDWSIEDDFGVRSPGPWRVEQTTKAA